MKEFFCFPVLRCQEFSSSKNLKVLFILTCFLFLTCCKHPDDPQTPTPATPTCDDNKGFPKDVAAIIINKCATPGCHTDQSSIASAGLSLTSWDNLFKGTTSGATIVPYRTNQSPFLAFVNSAAYPEYG